MVFCVKMDKFYDINHMIMLDRIQTMAFAERNRFLLSLKSNPYHHDTSLSSIYTDWQRFTVFSKSCRLNSVIDHVFSCDWYRYNFSFLHKTQFYYHQIWITKIYCRFLKISDVGGIEIIFEIRHGRDLGDFLIWAREGG